MSVLITKGKRIPAKLPGRRGGAPKSPAGVGKAPPGADARWQRTVRYGWDKGGSRGGR